MYDIRNIVLNKKVNIRESDYILRKNDKMLGRFDVIDDIYIELKENIEKGGQVGVYSQYPDKKHPKRDKWYCGYICVDIDLHGDLFSQQNLSKALELIKILKSKSEEYFLINEKYLYIEPTNHGYHIWIFLGEGVWQEKALSYIEIIQQNISIRFKEIFGEDYHVEFFPKGMVHKGGYGNAVFLHNKSQNKLESINKISKEEFHGIVDEANQQNYKSVRMRETNKPKSINRSSIKLEEGGLLDKYCNMICARKCISNVIKGEYDLRGDNGNTMRVRVVQELNSLGFPINEIVKAFQNQSDFNPNKSRYHIEKCVEKGYPYPTCDSIKKTGYCDPTCWMNGSTSDSEKPSYDSVEFEREYPVLGWQKNADPTKPTLFQKMKTIVSDSEDYFINKTTRSGTTSSVIIESIKQQKKVLMVAPTNKIFDKTVDKAIEIGNKDGHFSYKGDFFQLVPNKFKIVNNADLCQKIGYNTIGMDSIFPFLLKPKCDRCKAENCGFRKFKEKIADYSIVFITTQKLQVLVNIAEQSQEARSLLNDLIDWADLVFIDECYELFQINFDSLDIWREKLNSDGIKIFNKLDLIEDSLEEYGSILNNEFLLDLKKFITKLRELIKLEFRNYPYSKHIEIGKEWFEVFFEEPEKWAKQYGAFINAFRETEDLSIKNIVDIFLALSCKRVFIQQRITQQGERIISLISINDIEKFINFIKNIKKKLIVTDAVKPPIPIRKIWKDMKIENINDPNRSAEKQTVIIESEFDPFYTFGQSTLPFTEKNKRKLIKFINSLEINDEPVFIATQSKNYKKRFSFILNEEELQDFRSNIEKNTYHRSDETIGVASDIRKMICIGSSHIPRHVYDVAAKIYIELGLFDTDSYKLLGRFLENHNAMSAFFQTISRVKDPMGKEESKVWVFGMKAREVKKWFSELKISTPKLVYNK